MVDLPFWGQVFGHQGSGLSSAFWGQVFSRHGSTLSSNCLAFWGKDLGAKAPTTNAKKHLLQTPKSAYYKLSRFFVPKAVAKPIR
jgi:hypothetical protein